MPNTATSWEPGSTVLLCNVPWDSAYSNVVDWTLDSRESYFSDIASSGTSVELTKSAYMPVSVPVQIDVPYSVALRYNYLVVSNPPSPVEGDTGDTFYYFITQLERPNPHSTLVTVQLDVWTTRVPSMRLGVGYVRNGHIAMANEPALTGTPDSMRTYLSESEGIDVGTEMYPVFQAPFSLQEPTSTSTATVDYTIITSTVDLTSDFGTVSNPSLKTATGGTYGNLISGCNVYLCFGWVFPKLMLYLSQYPWISQCIINITIAPFCCVQTEYLEPVSINGGKFGTDNPVYTLSEKRDTYEPMQPSQIATADLAVFDYDSAWEGLEEYRSILKLRTYPYSVVELTNNQQSVFLKPQCFSSAKCPIDVLGFASQPDPQAVVFPERYCSETDENYFMDFRGSSTPGTKQQTIPYGTYLDTALWYDAFPQVTITNNSYIGYLASTAHTRAYSYSNAAWTSESANLAATNDFVNSTLYNALEYQTAQYNIQASETQRQNNMTQGVINTVANGVQGAANSIAMFTNPKTAAMGIASAVGTVAGAVSNATSTYTDYANATATIEASRSVANSQLSTRTTTTDNNYSLAAKVNAGDYKMAVAAIDASYADAALLQPSSSGNVGGSGFRYSVGLLFGGCLKYSRVSRGAIRRIGDFFLRFGYAINRFIAMPDTLVFNDHFSYWQVTQLTVLKFDGTELERDAIRGAFSQGLTVWKNPGEIGSVLPKDNQIDASKIATYYT